MADVVVEIFGDKDPFKNVRESSKQFLKVVNDLIKKSELLGSTFRKELQGIEFKGLKDVQKLNQQVTGLNKTLKATNDLRDAKVKLDKQVLDAEKKAIKTTQDALKVEQQKLRVDQQSIKVDQQKLKLQQDEERLAQAELRTKQAQIRTAQAALRASEQERKINERKNRTLEQSTNAYKRLTRVTNLAQAEFKRLAAEFGVNSKQAQNALRRFERLDNALRKINNAAKDGRRDVGRYGLALGKLQGGFLGVARNLAGALGVVGGLQLFVQVLRDSFNIIRTFGAAQSELAGILGQTKKEIADITELSKELGATTVFTATEVTKAATELAKLGLTNTEIEDSLKGVLDASVALGSEIPQTAALVASSLRAFNLEASESDRVAATLSVATTKSALDFEKLNTALGNVAPAAAAFGSSIEETTALLGLIVDKGIDASTAGTQLRNIFITLAKDGISLEDALETIATSQDKLTTANELFGKRSAVTALALADQRDQIDLATAAITGQDEALQALIDERLDNLDGDLKLLTSTWEGFILSIESGEGAINSVIRNAIQFLINSINEARAILSDLARPFQELFAELGKLANLLGISTEGFNAFNILIETTKLALSPLILLLKGVAIAITEVVKFIQFIVKEITDFVKSSALLRVALEKASKLFNFIGLAIQGLVVEFGKLRKTGRETATVIREFVSNLIDFIGALLRSFPPTEILLSLIDKLKEGFDDLIKGVREFSPLVDDLISSLESYGKVAKDGAKANKELEDSFDSANVAATGFASAIANLVSKQAERIGISDEEEDKVVGAINKQRKVIADLEKERAEADKKDIARLTERIRLARLELNELESLGDRFKEFKDEEARIEQETLVKRLTQNDMFTSDLKRLQDRQLNATSVEEFDKIGREIEDLQRANSVRLIEIQIEENNQRANLIQENRDLFADADSQILKIDEENARLRNSINQIEFDARKKLLQGDLEETEDVESKKTKNLGDELDKRLELIERYSENVENILNSVEQGLAERLKRQLEEINEELKDNEEIQDDLREKARDGNLEAQESLALQQKREAELEQQRTQLEKKQKQRELAFSFLRIFNARMAAYQAEVASTPEGQNPPNNTVLLDSLAEFGTTSALTTAIAGFIDGTENVGQAMGNAPLGNVVDNYIGETGGKIFRFDGREAILSPEQNKMRGSLSNDETVKIANQYLKGDLVEKSKVFDTAIAMTNALMALNSAKHSDYSGAMIKTLTGEIKGLRSDIKKLPDAMPVSHSGFNNKTGMIEEVVKRQGRVNTVLERLNRA